MNDDMSDIDELRLTNFVCDCFFVRNRSDLTFIETSDDFILAAAAPLNLVCFRHRAGDGTTEHIHHARGNLFAVRRAQS